MQRDTLASHIGHEDMLYFASIAENESVARVRFTMLEVGVLLRVTIQKMLHKASKSPRSCGCEVRKKRGREGRE